MIGSEVMAMYNGGLQTSENRIIIRNVKSFVKNKKNYKSYPLQLLPVYGIISLVFLCSVLDLIQ